MSSLDLFYDETYDDDDFEEYSFEEYEDLARRIRSLSNVIWLTGEHITYTHQATFANIDLRSVYRAMATLLTRDARQELGVAVTGDGMNIADATQIVALIPYRSTLDEPHLSAEAYTGADYDMLHPSPTSIEPHFGDGCLSNTSDDEEHAGILMGIIWTLADSPHILSTFGHEQRQAAFRFIYSQCWPEVLRCAEGANYVPKFSSTWHHIGSLPDYAPYLDSELPEATLEAIPACIAYRFVDKGMSDMLIDDNGEHLFSFCATTARVWFSILCDAVYDVLHQCESWRKEDYRPSPAQMDGIVHAMSALHMLYDLDAMQRLVHFHSLRIYLDRYHPHLNPDITPLLPQTRADAKAFNRAEHKILEEWREHGNVVGRLRRHVEGLLSWHNALTTVVHAMAYAQQQITLRLVRYRRPSDNWREHLLDVSVRGAMEMDRPLQSAKYEDVWRYLLSELPESEDMSKEDQLKLDSEIEERVQILDLPILEDTSSLRIFEGSVHTEALLMDILAQADDTNTRQKHPSLLTFANHDSPLNKIVGIPMQYDMCYCCSLLEARLLHDERPLFSTVRGPLVPWTPPILLHKDDTLEALHGALVQLLADIIETQEDAERSATPTSIMAE